ncbi:hypothetical protein ANCDUO_04282 [Ancylostoma duodenale]|uniref:Uncharacterized protein n=1 Tax=Ancylostoma duodenale TaxID=51022 RepID=A0A0C2GVG4_9BILA|nr:hypothetical protein ANCDUO_04282 [Ancylostoma duodenale]
MRFSEPPISVQAQIELVNCARGFLTAHPAESNLSLRVFKLTQEDSDWIADRRGDFVSYQTRHLAARKRMVQLFNMACSALAATNVISDDKSTHQVTATVPSLTSFPLRLRLHITGMSSESGWEALRPADVWIVDSATVGRTIVRRAQFSFETQSLDVELHTTIACHRSLMRAIERRGRGGESSWQWMFA